MNGQHMVGIRTERYQGCLTLKEKINNNIGVATTVNVHVLYNGNLYAETT